jgi:hypothetical protein
MAVGPTIHWRKSSFSGGDDNDCVELVGALDAVRDSRNPDGPVLRTDLCGFLTTVREGKFDQTRG